MPDLQSNLVATRSKNSKQSRIYVAVEGIMGNEVRIDMRCATARQPSVGDASVGRVPANSRSSLPSHQHDTSRPIVHINSVVGP